MEVDINVWRSIVTLLSLVLFVGLIAWTWNRKRLAAFDEAAHLPFLDDETASENAPRP